MTLIETARQALDALESDNPDIQLRAAIALRTAIEQAEQQEPVAWIEHIAGGVEYNPYHKAALKLPEGMRFDLYTTPPQRKPLTDEEIDRVTDQQWASNNHKPIYAAHRAYARAIERAHGIGN